MTDSCSQFEGTIDQASQDAGVADAPVGVHRERPPGSGRARRPAGNMR